MPFFFSLCVPAQSQAPSDPPAKCVHDLTTSQHLTTLETAIASSRSLLPFSLSQSLNSAQQAEQLS